MSPKPLLICLRWEDPATGERHEPLLCVPIALGRDFKSMPTQANGNRVSQLVLNSSEVSRFHALIDEDRGGLVIIDQNSSNGIFVNGQRQKRITISNGDVVQIGPYQISIALTASGATNGAATIEIPRSEEEAGSKEFSASSPSFPPSVFEAQQVSVQDLHATGLPVDEADYVAVGAGLGSFAWVDLLRIHGAKPSQIVALGLYEKPYGHYQKLCRNSQIFPHERLRSNSDSCPDNIWGWPSYALREAWRELIKGQIKTALGLLWQVFAEPAFAQTYTPRSGNVFAALDREAKRINWEQMYRYGRVRAIRKTDDGRYAIAYSRSTANQRDRAIIIARYVHIATGYPAIQFLPDLQA
ncbi:MAG TPA: hypothetical protein DCZ55_31805, partial [Cyanobacteria bacterium UBA11371]|nr:hypothetical protein [Cyanobacteria bacterium UBA11371]